MKSLRWRVACWYALSLLAVLGVILSVTYFHLQHELRVERWERAHPDHADWTLHGSYSESEIKDIMGELWHMSVLYAAPIVALSLGIGYLLAARSFRPVEDLKRQLGMIGARSLASRVQLHGADREFQEIESHINDLLARLEKSFQQLSEFSGQVAHELRTPLTLLRLQVEEAAGRIDPAMAESLQDELHRLSDYVDQCLILATAEQGRLVVKTEEVPLRELLADLVEAYEPWARSESRRIILEADPSLRVATDPRYLRQMLHNLLANAMRHGAGTIRIAAGSRDTEVFCLIENEVGTPKKDGRGSGIGLRVTSAVASALGCAFFTERPGPHRFVARIEWKADARRQAAAATA